MNFQLEENLNIKYEDWNHKMVDLEDELNSATVYGNYNYVLDGFTLTDDSCTQGPQNIDYSQGQRSSQMPQEVGSHTANQRHQNYLRNEWNEIKSVMGENIKNNYLNSSFDTLDDIDSECLFYQKSFTELTPVKCDVNNMSSISWGSPDSILSKSISNPDLERSLENFQENFQEISPSQELLEFNQNNFNEEWLLQELLSNDSCQELENELISNELSNDQHISQDSPMMICQNDFEKIFPNVSPNLSNEKSHFDNLFGYLETDSNIQSSNNSSFDDYKKESSEMVGESSWVKEIKEKKTSRPRGPKCWEFLLRLLNDSASNPSLVKWENTDIGSFKLVEKDKISAIWGNRPSKKKNGKVIKYESFARILRYHYKKGSGMVLPVSEKHLVYKFASKVMATYRAGKIL